MYSVAVAGEASRVRVDQRERRQPMSKLPLVVGMAAGASAMYLLDPSRGGDRRQRLWDQVQRARDKMSDNEGRLAPRDLISRTKEAVSDVRNRLSNGYREDIAAEEEMTAFNENPGGIPSD